MTEFTGTNDPDPDPPVLEKLFEYRLLHKRSGQVLHSYGFCEVHWPIGKKDFDSDRERKELKIHFVEKAKEMCAVCKNEW